MSQQEFERVAEELISAIDTLLESELVVPALLMLYASIDIMASLNRPESQSEVKSSDFIEWADRYLLCGTQLECSPEDLYGARCGLLHTYIAESRSSRVGEAKQIWYACDAFTAEEYWAWIDQADVPPVVAVHVDDLFAAFRFAVERFKHRLLSDPRKANLVYERTHKSFSNVLLLRNEGDSA